MAKPFNRGVYSKFFRPNSSLKVECLALQQYLCYLHKQYVYRSYTELTGGQDRMMAVKKVKIFDLLSRRILCISASFLQWDCLSIFHSFTCTNKPPGVLSPWHVLNQSCHYTHRTSPRSRLAFSTEKQMSKQTAVSAGQGLFYLLYPQKCQQTLTVTITGSNNALLQLSLSITLTNYINWFQLSWSSLPRIFWEHCLYIHIS